MSRDAIFANIRAALDGIQEKSTRPDYDDAILHALPRLAGTPRDAFTRNFTTAGGIVVPHAPSLADFLLRNGHTHGYCDPALLGIVGPALTGADFVVETSYDRTRCEDYQFGITRATGAIAESGSLILDDTRTTDRLAALSPWVHIALLRESEIHPTLPAAIAALGPDRYTIWVTGPSKTADVEGILIEGVHGPGVQIALIV